MWDTAKELLKGRGAQLAARYIAMGLVALGAKLGADVSNVDATSQQIATFAIAGILMLADHFLHAKSKEEEKK